MKVSLLQLRVRDGRMEEVLAEYAEHRILARSGARDGWLFTKGDTLNVVAIWADEDAYQRWLADPLRGESAARLAPMVDEVIASYLADRAVSAW